MVFKSIVKKHIKAGRGFTLPEMLVVIFIIGLMSTILVVNWRNNEKKLLIQRKAEEVVQNIYRSRDLALTGKAYCVVGLETKPCPAYGTNISLGSQNYLIFGDTDSNNSYSVTDQAIENLSIGEDVEVYSLVTIGAGRAVPSVLNLVFSVPDGFITINNDPTIFIAYIFLTRKNQNPSQDGNTKVILIQNTGKITVIQ